MNSEPPDGQGVWHYDETVNICNTYIFFPFFLIFSMYIYIYIPITYLPLDTPLPLLVFLFVCVIFKMSSALWLLFVQLMCVAVVFFGSSVLLVCYWAG